MSWLNLRFRTLPIAVLVTTMLLLPASRGGAPTVVSTDFLSPAHAPTELEYPDPADGEGPQAQASDIVVFPRDPRAAGGARGTNYLIIAAPDFVGSAPLTQFINAKTAQGFTVTLYAPALGTYGSAIKTYIQGLWGTSNAPAYALIIGDAYFNYPLVQPSNVPTCVITTPRYTLTDIPYACTDGVDDFQANFSIGRLPLTTVAELQAEVDKILYVEAGNYVDPTFTQRAVFIAGISPGADAEAREDLVIGTYMDPAGIQSTKVYGSLGATTQDISNAINAGSFLGVFYGHAAGTQAWASPNWAFSDIDALTNDNMYPFLISMSCGQSSFYFTDPTQSPGMLEKWLRVPNKGAAAAWGPSNTIEPYSWETWAEMFQFFFQAAYDEGIRELGPACDAAAAHFVDLHGLSDPVSRDYSLSFLYLGDPSMRLPEPPGENYLAVIPEGWFGTAPVNQFLAHKQAMGFNVMTYVVPAGTTRDAIRAYILGLWSTSNAPSYVLIMGDTDGTTASTTTTIPHFIGVGSKNAANDWPYVCFDGTSDWYPEIPIGRFPVSSETEMQAMVDKTVVVESSSASDGNYTKRAAFLANSDTYNTAEPTDDWIIANYLDPNGYESIKIYQAQGGDTQDVRDAVNAGVMFLTYMGHSSQSGWWGPSFGQGDVQALTNSGKYPIVFGWSCNTAHFDLSSECFGETWVRQTRKGGVAYISASNYIYWGSVEDWLPSAVLEKSFFAAFFEDNIWHMGSAWVQGLYRFLDEYGQPAVPGGPPTQNADVVRNFFEEFVILGDPGLLVPQPSGFRLTATPTEQGACVPPATSAWYGLNIEKMGSFAEVITLSATGVPPGATLTFSTNALAPPFTSTMTIGNLAGVPAGAYDITIHGVSATKLGDAFVHLDVFTSAPTTPQLTSPANGELGVARMPTLTWQAVAHAAQYDVEVARDSAFTQVVYSGTVAAPTATVGVELDPARTYYWHARSSNDCAASDYSTVFNFTTIAQTLYFTEQFGAGSEFDLSNQTLIFRPDASGSHYSMCGAAATGLPTDPTGGTTVNIGDDGHVEVTVGAGKQLALYGVAYSTFHICANGSITFNSGDGTYDETLPQHFALPRVAAMFDDLNPGTGGSVSWIQTSDRIAVTYDDVPEYQATGSNTFQIELFFDGLIRMTWLSTTSADSIVGLSAGGGVPSDFQPSNLSAFSPCEQPGACCVGTSCSIMYESGCYAAGGTFKGAGFTCDPNPCIVHESGCLIISELVQGTESGDCPRYLEITNTGLADFLFTEGGVIVQTGSSSDVTVDINLAGVNIPAGRAFVINSNAGGECTGAFYGIYGRQPDMSTNVIFGYGDERIILTDTADGSHLIDIYGQFGVDGTGQVWEWTDGYSYRLPSWNSGAGSVFRAEEWFIGGVGSLTGPNPTQLLFDLTTPGLHLYDEPCTGVRGDLDHDGDVDMGDWTMFAACLIGPDITASGSCAAADLDFDGDVDLDDLSVLQAAFTGPLP